VKIGTLSHTPAQILANIKTALPAVAQTIKGCWDNIQSFHIKTHSSVGLPIWACNLDDADGGRWNGWTKDELS
jgi:ribosome biogenesis protein UTP30